MKNSIIPTKSSERISSIDILRGFALLGIVLVNSLGFNASFFDFGGFYANLPNDFQKGFYTIYISLTADKFIFLFSFLFGYGIFMQFDKFNDSKEHFNLFFSKRMLILFLFGFAHVLFLWAGDILILYSVTGLFMLLIYKIPTKWLLFLAMIFYFLIGIWLSVSVWIHLPNALSSTCTECLQQAKLIYASGNYLECLNLRLQEYFAFRNINTFYYLPKIIGLTILGFVGAKYHLHQKVAAKKMKWFFVLMAFTIIGIALYFGFEKIVNTQSRFANAISMTGYELTNLFVAGSYLLLILWLSSFRNIAKFLRPISLMGRMSLTNYIFQSLMFSIIFYGWGMGLFGLTKVTSVVFIAISVYVFQVILNLIWFKYYQQGPLEKLWRKWSYKDY